MTAAARLISTYDPDAIPEYQDGAPIERAAFNLYREFISARSYMFAHGPTGVDDFTARRRWLGMPERTRQGWRDQAKLGAGE